MYHFVVSLYATVGAFPSADRDIGGSQFAREQILCKVERMGCEYLHSLEHFGNRRATSITEFL